MRLQIEPRAGPRRRPAALVLVVAACLAVACMPARAQSGDAIAGFVDRLNAATVALSASGTGPEARQACRRLLAWAFDVPTMARNTLGEPWQSATAAQRTEFVQAFEEAFITGYLRRLAANRGVTLTFVGARGEEGGYQFAASRMLSNGRERTLIWRLRPAGRSWRVIDIVADGGSVLQAQRRDYVRVLADHPGGIGAVIAFIRGQEAR